MIEAIPTRHNEATVAQLQADMAAGRPSSEELTKEYLARILALDKNGPGVNSIIELNHEATLTRPARQADLAPNGKGKGLSLPHHL
jgi:Asp-tRNA(Asn)/Glu-tRNA(Gln) amidotransferase A subunit family amidase